MVRSKADYDGLFLPRDGVGTGHLNISGKDTQLKLLSAGPWEGGDEEFRDLHGVLSDGTKASLIECVWLGATDHRWGEETQSEQRFFPHYVLTGESYISSGEDKIRAINYHFENVHCLVNGFKTFGNIHPTQDEFRDILKSEHERHQGIAENHNWGTSEFDPEIGDHPFLMYFSGLWEIVKCHAELGAVSLTNRSSHGFGSSQGVGIKNEITVNLEFANLMPVSKAFQSLSILHSFFELCLGRRQRYLWIEAVLDDKGVESSGRMPPQLDVHWSYCNEQITGETEPTQYGDILIDPGAEKEEFSKMLSGWLNTNSVIGEARGRFSSAFHSGAYGIDRIVGAANMFDLLPESHVPAKIELDDETNAAVETCRKQFKGLPDSFARQSVLSVLGRVGTASLRDKICHRADILIKAAPEKFAEIHLPCSQAVHCRNHFVHGSDVAFDYREHFNGFAFLVDTLEFVFAASDLIELGWDYNSWRAKGSSLSHNFGAYVVNYEGNLRILKGLLKS
ncbi:HEPN domain-containing protein [Magnetovibrio sp.]|uniref:ApeA N-terminal domain 1-containing protein n=1 Tax=Magnetovibrio sp. TaxID=2024836 RepID=UPI002F936356